MHGLASDIDHFVAVRVAGTVSHQGKKDWAPYEAGGLPLPPLQKTTKSTCGHWRPEIGVSSRTVKALDRHVPVS